MCFCDKNKERVGKTGKLNLSRWMWTLPLKSPILQGNYYTPSYNSPLQQERNKEN